jgi:GntR family transcriptional regulator
VLPFSVEIKPGNPIAEQVIFAAPFPSVRRLSQELAINPNTAHKIVASLVGEGVLTMTPAVGSVVAETGIADRATRAGLIDGDLERLVVEAKKLGLSQEELSAALERHWERLGKK